MSKLVETLKSEHTNIATILAKVVKLGPETPEGHKMLMAARNGLIAHLEREDRELYPVLIDAAKEDSVIEDALEFFHENIATVAGQVMAFFEKYEDPQNLEQFAQDFDQLLHILTQRIQKEEAVIYKYYDELEGWT